jgi:hypothetical protein
VCYEGTNDEPLFLNVREAPGAGMLLCINKKYTGTIAISGIKKTQLADGWILECDVASCVELYFKNRRTICNAMTLPGDSEPLLGCIPLEDMDVLIRPLRQDLIVNPDRPYFV